MSPSYALRVQASPSFSHTAERSKIEVHSPSRVMTATLSRALAALVPAGILFVGSVLLFHRERILGSFLQLVGAGCLVMVVLTHLCEALHLFPWMHWGSEHSIGHYLDLWSAVLGLTLFPIGYLLYALPSARLMCRRTEAQIDMKRTLPFMEERK